MRIVLLVQQSKHLENEAACCRNAYPVLTPVQSTEQERIAQVAPAHVPQRWCNGFAWYLYQSCNTWHHTLPHNFHLENFCFPSPEIREPMWHINQYVKKYVTTACFLSSMYTSELTWAWWPLPDYKTIRDKKPALPGFRTFAKIEIPCHSLVHKQHRGTPKSFFHQVLQELKAYHASLNVALGI